MTRALQHCVLLLTLSFFFSTTSFSQIVQIDYVNPTNFTVCDSTTYEVTITNNLPDSIRNVNLSADLPGGIFYLQNTVVNAIEDNISNLNLPVFGLPNMGSGDAITLTFNARTDCSLIDAINAGTLFSNNYQVNYDGGNNMVTTIPYVIETPLVLIGNTTNTVASGTKGDVIIRTFSFTNTRLGSLSKITFQDIHNAGVEITTDIGMVSNNTSTFFEIMLTGVDFTNFGDGDELFELGETITVTEEILIIDCGFDVNSINSTINVLWGCGIETCQTDFTTAVINLVPSPQNPQLVVESHITIPTDYCGQKSVQQGMTITNAGNVEATNISFSINHNNEGTVGVDQNTLIIDSAGVMIMPNVVFTNPVSFTNCGTPTDLSDGITIFLLELGPNESVSFFWDAYTCKDGCGSAPPAWAYEFKYDLFCPEGEIREGQGTSDLGNIPALMVDSITYFIGVPLMDDSSYVINYALSSPFLIDSTGLLTIDFILPCGLGWAGTEMLLNGQAPQTTTITPTGTDTIITLVYTLPLGAFTVNSDFEVTFDCDVPCIFKPECGVGVETSCPPLSICALSLDAPPAPPPILDVEIITTISFDSTVTNNCSLKECDAFELVYECPADSICSIDTMLGYLDFDMDFFRTSLGFADNDDDRLRDPGPLNLNNIRQDRAVAGDTVRTTIEGAVVMDVPGGTLDNGEILVRFEAHTIDDGIDGGEVLNFGPPSRLLMTAENGFQNLGATLRIVDQSTGQEYTCDLPEPATVDTLFVSIELVNTRPPAIFDEILYMTFRYNITPAVLAALGCGIPADFVYEEGDSLIFASDHRVLHNIVEGGTPRVVNLRTSTGVGFFNSSGPYQNNLFACHCQSRFWQLSGYRHIFSLGLYDLPPCEPSDEPGGTRFDFLLGMGNFFPFEFRNFTTLTEWQYAIPPQVQLLESELLFLALQGGGTLFSNDILSPNIIGNLTNFDLLQFQVPELDEGFSFRFRHLWEMPCEVEDNLPLELHASLDINTLPDPSPLDTIIIDNIFRPKRPLLIFTPDNINFVSFDNLAVWEFDVANFPDLTAPNVWIQPVSSTGLLSDFMLTNLTTGAVIPLQNGLFQLGDFLVGMQNTFQLTALLESCELETLTFNYGWDCEPYTSTLEPACFQESYDLFVESPPGEIEMDVFSPTMPIDLCDTVPYHTIEIFNAQVGAVYNINLEAVLPPGLFIVPGSSQIAFPTGSGWNNVADPMDLGGGVVAWDLAALDSDLAMAGLKGFNFAPENSVSIRFLSATECGFISSSQVIFTATGTQNCDLPTNTLSRAGNPINIIGVTPPYQANLSVVTNAPPTISCGDDLTFSINMQADGVTLTGDSIFVFLPVGVSYVGGSYVPGPNAPLNEPFIQIGNGQQILKWEIPAGLPPNTPLSFDLTTTGYGLEGCDASIIQVKTVQKQEAVCIVTGELCEVLAETGTTSFTVTTTFPDLQMQNFMIDANISGVNYTLTILNNGAATSEPIVIDFYLDNDGNGVVSAGDVLLGSEIYNSPLGMGGIANIAGNFGVNYEEMCNIIAIIDSENNCICDSEIATANGPLFNTLPPIETCSGVDRPIGISEINGHSYQWVPNDNLQNASAAMTIFNFENMGTLPQTFNYTLVDNNNDGCTIQNTLAITVQPQPKIIGNDTLICAGQPVTLTTTKGETYNWSGPGITDPNQQTQIVTPTQTSVYMVTVIDSVGCEGTDEITIDVNAAPIVNAGADQEECADVNITLSGNVPAGTTIDWSPGILLNDSTIASPTILINVTNTYTLTVTDAEGCSNTDEVTITFNQLPGLSLTPDTQICAGEVTELSVNGASTYTWSPDDDLDCNDCPIVQANPTTTTTYTVIGTSTEGCSSEASVQVSVAGAIDFEASDMLICPGDVITLFGDQVSEAGVYCDTLSNVEGCDSITCITVGIQVTETVQDTFLCDGDSITLYGQVFYEAGVVSDTFDLVSLGCDSIHTFNVIALDTPFVDMPNFACIPEESSFDEINLPPNLIYEWIPSNSDLISCASCPDPSLTPLTDTTYTVVVTSAEGCTNEFDIEVILIPACGLEAIEMKVPNAFTPDNDGTNDKFGIIDDDALAKVFDGIENSIHLTVWNRWGQKIYEGEGGIDKRWDGSFKENPSQADVYVYTLEIQCGEVVEKMVGDVTLLR